MLFNSQEFIFFFVPLTFCVYQIFIRSYNKGAKLWLILCSLFFYAYWNPVYVILLITSIATNYGCSVFILRNPTSSIRKLFLLLGITANLAAIGYFKYANFFVENFNHLTGFGFATNQILLPLAISFFTFQQIAYIVDVYLGKETKSTISEYILFVVFFPQLIAGPIVHHKEMMPQFRKLGLHLNSQYFWGGLSFFSIGLFKKLVIADNVAGNANLVFDGYVNGITFSFVETWIGILSYTFQIYFDFSGYSDMAIGLALLMGIVLPINFNSPYKACSIIDFWRRWHITLGRFLRNYLYIPLGGNRRGQFRKQFNIVITMFLGGLWHGASWNFVTWGLIHGLALGINHWFRKFIKIPMNLFCISIFSLLTFFVVCVGWIFFRASDLPTSMNILQVSLGLGGLDLPRGMGGHIVINTFDNLFRFDGAFTSGLLNYHSIWGILACFLIVRFFPSSLEIMKWKKHKVNNTVPFDRKITPIWNFLMGILFFVSVKPLFDSNSSEFLYFNF